MVSGRELNYCQSYNIWSHILICILNSLTNYPCPANIHKRRCLHNAFGLTYSVLSILSVCVCNHDSSSLSNFDISVSVNYCCFNCTIRLSNRELCHSWQIKLKKGCQEEKLMKLIFYLFVWHYVATNASQFFAQECLKIREVQTLSYTIKHI